MTLDRVLPDAIDDGVREIQVQVAEEHNAVLILERNEAGVKQSPSSPPSSHFCNTHFDQVNPCLQASRALKGSTEPQILVPDQSDT